MDSVPLSASEMWQFVLELTLCLPVVVCGVAATPSAFLLACAGLITDKPSSRGRLLYHLALPNYVNGAL
jgi:hypothetical protein